MDYLSYVLLRSSLRKKTSKCMVRKALVRLHTIFPSFVIVLTLICIVYIQINYDSAQGPFSPGLEAKSRTLLPEKLLPHISLGFNTFLADMYWIRAVQDLTTWTGNDPYYLNYFKNISTLDPRFEYPYLFSILTIPQSAKREKDIQPLHEVAKVAERGIAAIPSSWQIPFYLATQYYIFNKQYEPAESYLSIAASKEGAPDGVYLVYSTFVGKNLVRTKNLLNNPDANSTINQLVKVIYNNTDNETTKELIAKGYQAEAVRQMLEKGIIAYKERYKKYPDNALQMIEARFIQLPEGFLDHFTVTINKRNGEFSVIAK